MIARRISRRTLLRAVGVSLALPALELMVPYRARAQSSGPKRFIGFFYPNGTDGRFWDPKEGPLSAEALPPCLQDLNGFAAEGIWPAGGATYGDITVVTGIDHSGVCVDIHMPSLALCAHRGAKLKYVPSEATLDQVIAEHVQGDSPYRVLSLSATDDQDIGQGHISFRAMGQAESVIRSPQQAFEMLFAGRAAMGGSTDRKAARHQRVLDLVLEEAKRLKARVGVDDQRRLEQYFDAVHELDTQLGSTSMANTCAPPDAPSGGGRNWHQDSKHFMDIAVLAMACDLTRVATIQYSNSWGVHYKGYNIGEGREALAEWSDHFISHKLDDGDRATDLDGLQRAEAQRIADARVILTSRFKARRFAYLVEKLKSIQTPTGLLYDETMAMYVSENGDGDSHARTNMPTLLAGGVGGFKTGRAVAAPRQPTGALHASVLRYFGVDVGMYGDPAGSALAAL